MADAPRVAALLNALDQLSKVNLDGALKKNLGEMNLLSAFEPRIKGITDLREHIKVGAPEADNRQVINLQNLIDTLVGNLNNLFNMSAPDFTQQRPNLVNVLDEQIGQIRSAMLPMMVWHLQGQLEGGLQQSIRSEIASMRDEVNTRVGVYQNRFQTLEENAMKMLNDLKAQTETVIENAKQLDLTKRQQFKEVSIDSSKLQFQGLTKRFLAWGVITGLLAAAMLCGLIWFLLNALNGLHEYASMQDAVAASVIRIALIGVLGAFAAILIKICRGNLNMYYHTMHRAHLTTLIQQFVNAGENAEQRGAIFIKMVDAIASFGSSGLISGSDDAASLKIVSDFLPSLLKERA